MSSRSIASRSDRPARRGAWGLGALVALALLLVAGPAAAGRRIVVLEFDGPKGERFRDDVEAAIKKGKHTIVSLDDWTEKAESLRAEKVTARNVRKVAGKLKVDGVVVGDVEKRGSRYYLHIRLREGLTGEYVAEVEVVVRGTKLGSDGARVIKDELLPAIEELEANRGGDDDDEEEARSKKKKKSGFGKRRGDDEEDDEEAEDEEEEDESRKKTAKKGKKGQKSKKGKKGKRDEEDEEDEDEDDAREARAKKKGKKGKRDDEEEDEEEDDEEEDDDEERVALGDDEADDRDDDDDDGSIEDRVTLEGDAALLLPAIEVGAGMSFTARRLGFTPAPGIAEIQGYTGNPVAGVVITADVFPLAARGKRGSPLANLGLTALFDRVVKIESRVKYTDDAMVQQELALPSKQQRYSVGLIYRHPVSDKLAVEGTVRYNRMKFRIDRSAADAANVVVQVPNVDYAFVDPGVGVRYVLGPKMVFAGGVSFGFVLDAGEVQLAEQYGAAQILGFDLDAGVSYHLSPKIVVRGEARLTTFGYSFEGNGAMTDPNMDGVVDIPSGRDTYFGAAATASYQF